MFNLRSFDMNLLKVFEAVFEARSVGIAADRLALSQAATSHALSRLRHACADPLFVRTGQQFQPTPAAQALFPKVQEALNILRNGMSDTLGFDPTSAQRRFHVTIPHPLGPVIAHNLRVAMANAAPGIELRIDTMTMPPDMSGEMQAGIIDLAIDWLQIDQEQFVNKRIVNETLMLIVRGGHPRIGTAPTLDEIRKEDFVWLYPRRTHEQRPKAVNDIEGLGLRVALQVSEWLEVPALVAMFDLLSFIPRSMSLMVAERMQINVLPFPVRLPQVPIYAVWHESRRNDPAHRWLRELVAAELQRQTEDAAIPAAPILQQPREGLGAMP